MQEIEPGISIGVVKNNHGDLVLIYRDEARGANGVRITDAEAAQVQEMLNGATKTTELSLNNGRAVLRLEKDGSDYRIVWAGNSKYSDKKTMISLSTRAKLTTDIDAVRKL